MSPSAKNQVPPPPPGAPAAASVPLEEPTDPHDPLPPKPEQQSPATVSPTGADLDAPADDDEPAGRLPHHVHRGAAARHRPLAAGRLAGPDPAAGPPPAREDHPLRPRAHPRAGGARPRRRRARHLRGLRQRLRPDLGGVPRQGRRDTGVRALLDRRGFARLGRHGARHPRLRGEVLHRAGQLRPRRQQHPGLLHPGRHQVPRRHPRGQAAPRPRDPPGPDGARHLLGLRLAAHRGPAPRHLGDVRPRHPPVLPAHGGLRRAHLPARQRRAATPRWSSSTGSRASACTPSPGRRPSCSAAPTPTSTGATSTTPSSPAPTRSGSSASRPSRTPRSRPSRASTCSTPPRSCPRSSPPCSRSAC